MIAVGIALIALGVLFLFFVPWIGIPLGIVGLVLAALFLLGVGRETARRTPPADRQV